MPNEILTIDLTKISPDYTYPLFSFFKNSDLKKWNKDTTYHFMDGTEFKLKQDVFERARKQRQEGLDPGVRYQVIDDSKLFGSGGFSKVFKVGTLAFKDNGASRYYMQGSDGCERLYKLQKINVTNYLNLKVRKNPYLVNFNAQEEDLIIREATLAALTDHLHIKEPTFLIEEDSAGRKYRTSYTVMDRLPGDELFDVLYERRIRTSKERAELSLLLLIKYNEQVFKKALIHKDIKPDNIRLLLKPGQPMALNFFDYGTAVKSNASVEELSEHAGTEPYMSPECAFDKPVSYLTDIFSLARVLSLIWNINLHHFMRYKPVPRNVQEYKHGLSETNKNLIDNLNSLFEGITDLDQTNKEAIQQILKRMLEIDSEKRCTIYEAMAVFSEVAFRLGVLSETKKQVPETKKEKLYVEPSKWSLQIQKMEDTFNAFMEVLKLDKSTSSSPGFFVEINFDENKVLETEAVNYYQDYRKLVDTVRQINTLEKLPEQKDREIKLLLDVFINERSVAYSKSLKPSLAETGNAWIEAVVAAAKSLGKEEVAQTRNGILMLG